MDDYTVSIIREKRRKLKELQLPASERASKMLALINSYILWTSY